LTYNNKLTAQDARRVAEHKKIAAKAERSRQLRSAKSKQRRNLKPKSPRSRGWTDDLSVDWDELDYEGVERIMPRDEGDRRRAIEQAAFSAPAPQAEAVGAGPRARPNETAIPDGTLKGLVTSVSNGLCSVDVGGRTLLCSIRGALSARQTEFTNAVAVGDQVAITEDGVGAGVIEATLPRRSVLTRPDVGHLRQLIVANAEQLLVVSSWREPVIWLELIDRYLIAAARSGLRPIICVNKMDLVEDKAGFEAAVRPYRALGYRVMPTSARTGEGITEMRDALKGRVTVLVGMSGTGKSSLASAVQPGLNLRTAAVSDWSGEGRHTTTQATLLRLEIGGSVVDTPGIREFGLSGLRRQETAGFFPEIASQAPGCRFSDCSHLSEPDCAVRMGAASGIVPHSRYHSYKLIYESLPA
jgi:ribosome biogenesis GTPase